MYDVINLLKNAASLDTAPEFDAYSKVEVILAKEGNENRVVTVGDDSGRKLTIEMTQCADTEQARAAAVRILASLRGFQYQPYTATDALLDPAAEIGDAININGVYSGIYNKEVTFSPLMKTKLTAPQDEALDHEYAIKTQTNKTLTREMGQAYSQMFINATAIRSEVKRANDAEGELRSSIEQTAEAISAKVDSSNNYGESFGWTLTSDAWSVYANGRNEVFRIDENGATIKGIIKATSGEIGGFTIGSSALYNNISSMSGSQTNGVYIGTDGIKLGQNFQVDRAGNLTIKGTLSVGGENITAANLRQGATRGNRVGGGMSGNGSSVTEQFSCGYMHVSQFSCNSLSVDTTSFNIYGKKYEPKGITVDGKTYTVLAQ